MSSNATVFSSRAFFSTLFASTPNKLTLTQHTVVGAMTGFVISFFDCPIELLKVRCQVDSTSVPFQSTLIASTKGLWIAVSKLFAQRASKGFTRAWLSRYCVIFPGTLLIRQFILFQLCVVLPDLRSCQKKYLPQLPSLIFDHVCGWRCCWSDSMGRVLPIRCRQVSVMHLRVPQLSSGFNGLRQSWPLHNARQTFMQPTICPASGKALDRPWCGDSSQTVWFCLFHFKGITFLVYEITISRLKL